MNSLSNFNKHFVILAAFSLTSGITAQAQNPVESTHVDEKYAYTTVVYKKTAAADKDVLSSLENDFSIGDVVRVTVAPPAQPSPVAASEPVYIDKSKGEDTWLSHSAKSTGNLSPASNLSAAPKTGINTIAASPKPVPVAAKTAKPKPVATTETPKAMVTEQVKSTPVTEQTIAALPVTPTVSTSNTTLKVKASSAGKSAKAHKSVKKSGKKAGYNMKFKNRKHGKQRYACPKF